MADSGAGFVANPGKYRPDARALDDEEQGYQDDFHWLTSDEFVDAYHKSPYYENTLKYIEKSTSTSSSSSGAKLSSSDPALEGGHHEPVYPTSGLKQFYLLTKRAFTKEWRDMETNRSRIVSALFLSLVLGTLFLRIGNHQDDARTKLGLVFTIMAYFSFSSLNALPNIIAERAVYYYQRDTRYYSPLPYILSNILAEVNHQFACVRA